MEIAIFVMVGLVFAAVVFMGWQLFSVMVDVFGVLVEIRAEMHERWMKEKAKEIVEMGNRK